MAWYPMGIQDGIASFSAATPPFCRDLIGGINMIGTNAADWNPPESHRDIGYGAFINRFAPSSFGASAVPDALFNLNAPCAISCWTVVHSALSGFFSNSGVLNAVKSGAIDIVSGTTVLTADDPLSRAPAYHCCAVAGNGTLKLYLNGREDGSAAWAGTFTGAGNICIGRDDNLGGTDRYVGLITDVRVYGRELSPGEVWEMYDLRTRWNLYAASLDQILVPATIGAPAGRMGYVRPNKLRPSIFAPGLAR